MRGSPTTFCRKRITGSCAQRQLTTATRIAANLVHDHRRHLRIDRIETTETLDAADGRPGADLAAGTACRLDLARAMARLKPRERDLLWLAYAHGSTHQEIADTLGLKRSSIKLLLFRARRRLAGFLRDPRAAHPADTPGAAAGLARLTSKRD